MSLSDLGYMQPTLGETFDDIFEEPQEYGFIEEPPHWAVRLWPWPRIAALTDDYDDYGESANEGIWRIGLSERLPVLISRHRLRAVRFHHGPLVLHCRSMPGRRRGARRRFGRSRHHDAFRAD